MERIRFWFARLVMVYAAAINTFLGLLFLTVPTRAEKFGLTFSDFPASYGYIRTTTAALFLGVALTALYGLIRPRQFLACLWFVVAMTGSIVFTRLYGIAVDGASAITLIELRDEGLSWLLFIAALATYPRTRL